MVGTFASSEPGLASPATRHYTIVPANADLPFVTRAIYCSVAGTAIIRDLAGTDITYTLAAGDVLPIRAVQVRAASTATLVAWY